MTPLIISRNYSRLSCQVRRQTPFIRLAHSSAAVRSQFSKREEAYEANWVSREEREVLTKLFHRINTVSDPDGKQTRASLSAILKKHSVPISDSLFQALETWRHEIHGI